MTNAFHHLIQRMMRSTLALILGLILVLSSFSGSAYAAKTSMTGDYVKDTVSVAHTLQETISIPEEDENRSQANKEAVVLITDYIARYRNRPKFNQTVSYTTMQTALNSMAGHIKTYTNRPLPEELKTRLVKELTKAEKLVLSDS